MTAAATGQTGQWQEGENRHHIADVPHPIVVGALLVRLCRQELVRGIGRRNGTTHTEVGDDAMHVDWVEQVILAPRKGRKRERDQSEHCSADQEALGLLLF